MNNETVYNAAYFIAKFEAIPEPLWCIGNYERGKARCAYGHCSDNRIERNALKEISLNRRTRATVIEVNDGFGDGGRLYPQPTPKQRVLAWLRDAKEAGL